MILGVKVKIKILRIYAFLGWTETVEHYNDLDEFIDISEIEHICLNELYSISTNQSMAINGEVNEEE